jgi:hypothetical protein
VDDDVRQLERRHHLTQPCHPSQQRLDERHLDVRPRDRDDEPRQAGTRTDVDQPHVRRHELDHCGAVQQVPLPQPRHLTRAEQSAFHAGRRQRLRVPLGHLESIAEELPCRGVHPCRTVSGGHA